MGNTAKYSLKLNNVRKIIEEFEIHDDHIVEMSFPITASNETDYERIALLKRISGNTKKYTSETRGGANRCKRYAWWYDDKKGKLNIENEEGLFHRFHMDEILQILNSIKSEFGKDYFPLANNVEKLSKGTEIRGLGTIILDHSPKDVLHAQGASYFGPVFEQLGFFEWNGKHKGIEWRFRKNKKIDEKTVIEKLTYLKKG
jgi:hypothetical protein